MASQTHSFHVFSLQINEITVVNKALVSDKSYIHILTGSLLPLAAVISDHLGWGRSIGTDVEIRSGRLTGKLSTPAIKGYQKVKSIKRVFK